MSDEKPKTIEYVIDYHAETRRALETALDAFTPTYLRRVPRASVFVTPEREASLLETLATIPGITYRRGVPRKALDERVDE